MKWMSAVKYTEQNALDTELTSHPDLKAKFSLNAKRTHDQVRSTSQNLEDSLYCLWRNYVCCENIVTV